MNILIISRAIFPNTAPRAHRATELAKELSKQGHTVTLCAVLGHYNYTEFQKETNIQVDNLGISRFEWICSDEAKRKISLWRLGVDFLLSRHFAFPECLIGRRIKKYLKSANDIDAIITIAIPYTIHWSTGYCKRHYSNIANTKWISDCGDPFMGNPYSSHPFYFKWIEKKWCKTTDYITVPTEKAITAYYPEFRNKIRVIPQGFPFGTKIAEYHPNKVVAFAYSGMVYPQKRDPRKLLDYLCSIQREFLFVVYTNHKELFLPYVEKLGSKIEFREYVQRDKLVYELSKMDFLINISNESTVQVPSKLIDYYQTGRPTINISSAFSEQEYFDEFFNGDYSHQYVIDNPEQYDIKNVCDKFLELCD